MDYVKGEVCGIDNCRVRQYYVEDGLWFCKNGHRKEGRVQIGEDDGGIQGSQARVTRKAKEVVEKPVSRLQGKEAFKLYLRCYQLIIQRQIHWLIHAQNFPTEIEEVARGLWALRLQSISSKTGETSEHQSQSETETAISSGGSDSERSKNPSLVDTICICYVACLILRLPYTVGDFHRWIVDEQIVYFRAVRHIPDKMRDALPSRLRNSLDTRAVLQPDKLLLSVRAFIMRMHRDNGLTPPPINYEQCLFGFMVTLALPLEAYTTTISLSQFVKSSFSYPLTWTKGRHNVLSSLPEVHLMALFVIAVKLIWGFDSALGQTVHPRSDAEPAATRIDWQVWQRAMANEPSTASRLFQRTLDRPAARAAELDEQDMLSLERPELDRYMDWYHATWLPDARPRFPEQLQRMFPAGDLPEKRTDAGREEQQGTAEAAFGRITAVVNGLQEVPVRADDDDDDGSEVQRPGARYLKYGSERALEGVARSFYALAAEAVGVRLDTMVAAVLAVERLLDRQELELRKGDEEEAGDGGVEAEMQDGEEGAEGRDEVMAD